jgi:DNA polymerase epsilon subunit 2
MVVPNVPQIGIYNSFEDVAKMVFSKEGHEKSKLRQSVFAPGDSRSLMFQQRYFTILHQLFRDARFIDTARGRRGADFPLIGEAHRVVNSESLFRIHEETDDGNWRFEITPVESLAGSSGTKVVLGFLAKGIDGKLGLEDIHQTVIVKLDPAMLASDDYITEQMFVLAKGEMIDDVFVIFEMTLPPVPQRSLCESTVNIFGGPAEATNELVMHLVGDAPADASIAVLADVVLDDPRTIANLDVLFSGFEEAEAIPPVFVLMGNFTPAPFRQMNGDWVRNFQKSMDSLSHVLGRHPTTLANSRIVLVPGPNDASNGILPQPPLSDALTRGIATRFPSVVLATNPCRIRFFNRDLVFFNGSIVTPLKRNRIVAPAVGHDDDGADKLVRAVLSQCHLCPGLADRNSIVWDHDAGLRMYPPPHALFLSEPDIGPFQKELGETIFVSMPKFNIIAGDFQLYTPHGNDATISSVVQADN